MATEFGMIGLVLEEPVVCSKTKKKNHNSKDTGWCHHQCTSELMRPREGNRYFCWLEESGRAGESGRKREREDDDDTGLHG